MNAGRMRPLSVCCIPPFFSQIASMTKPPPAVRTQVMSAAQLIDAPSLAFHDEENANLYTIEEDLETQFEQHLARRVVGETIVRLAAHALDLRAGECMRGETGPHAAVDLRRLRTLADERAKRARRRRDHSSAVRHLHHGGLIAERSHRLAHRLDSVAQCLRGANPGVVCKAIRELRPHLTQTLLPTALGQRV